MRVGILGLGTGGTGTYRVLQRNQQDIAARAGRTIAVTHAAVRNLDRARAVVGDCVTLLQDPFAVACHPDIDVVVETVGGTAIAKDLVLHAIASGKHVVTANKALLAEHGNAIFAAAQAKGVVVAYEGAVAVSIPIIKALRECLTANRIEWIAGIINGTSNFILTQMVEDNVPFATALQHAQRLGYAEADPRFDVQGTDAAHKLSILAAIAFGTPIRWDCVTTQGIENVQLRDLQCARRMGLHMKLLATAQRTEAGIVLQVRPTLVPANHLLAYVHGSMNGILVQSDAAGLQMFYGAGAGSEETGSSVIADLVDIARMSHGPNVIPPLGFERPTQDRILPAREAGLLSSYYLRCSMPSRTLDVGRALGDQRYASVESHCLIPLEPPQTGVDLTLLTRPITAQQLKDLQQALHAFAQEGERTVAYPVHSYTCKSFVSAAVTRSAH